VRDVDEFFRAYGAAFQARDLAAVCALWSFPAHIVSDGVDQVSAVVVPSAEAFRGPLEHLFDMYSRVGCKRIEVRALEVDELSGSLRRATVKWGLVGLADLPLYDFTTSYLLARLEGHWRALSAVSHDELKQYRRFIGR
jgi:hypothetical protein